MDFFDEEYNRQQAAYGNTGAGYSNPPPVPTRNRNKFVHNVLTIVALVAVFVVGIIVGQVVKTDETEILDDVLQTVKDNSIYYDEATWEEIKTQMLLNAGTSMLQTVDKYGYLLSPEQLYDVYYPSSNTSTPTYGISFLNITTGYYVYSISYGSGAYVSDLRVGDIVILINKDGATVDVRNATSEEIQSVLSGDYGATVTLTVIRGLDTAADSDDLSVLKISVTKQRYENNFVDYYYGSSYTDITDAALIAKHNLTDLDGTDVGYVKLNSFESVYEDEQVVDSSSKQFAAAMQIFKTVYKGKGKLILDLTGNPGGDISEATSIASYLIYDFDNPNAEKLLVTTLKGKGGATLGTYYTDGVYFGDYFDVSAGKNAKPIVVITDGNSASASELLLGCLLDYGTATQIGSTSYGKGIAQTVNVLFTSRGTFVRDGKELTFYYGVYYTMAEYFSAVTDTNIHGVGYIPLEENRVDTLDYAALINRAKEILGQEQQSGNNWV